MTPPDHIEKHFQRIDSLLRIAILKKHLLELHEETARTSEQDSKNAVASTEAAIEDYRKKFEQQSEELQSSDDKLPLIRLREVFSLTEEEFNIVLLAIAPSVDSSYEDVYAAINGDEQKGYATPRLIRKVLSSDLKSQVAIRRALLPSGQLVRNGILTALPTTLEQVGNPNMVPLHVPDDLIHFLIGGELDGDYRVRQIIKSPDMTNPQQFYRAFPAMESVVDIIENSSVRNRLYLQGRKGTNFRAACEYLAKKLGSPLLLIASAEMRNLNREDVVDVILKMGREARILKAVVQVNQFDQLVESEQQEISGLLREAFQDNSVVVYTGEKSVDLGHIAPDGDCTHLEFPLPTAEEREDYWKQSLNHDHKPADNLSARDLANTYQFTEGEIRFTANIARRISDLKNQDAGVDVESIREALKSSNTRGLSRLADRIEPQYTWEQLILPPRQKQTLRDVCAQFRRSAFVLEEWNFRSVFPTGNGLKVLLGGPSGTGKTMAAGIIARELKLELYRIDLSKIVSKYIGETEKKLSRLFDEAAGAPVLLLFDEADALFGKRSEVRDSHDRYANIEIDYLLQKMEDHEGISILASNMRESLDEAFLRRLQFIIDFPFPDTHQRHEIWTRMIPPEAPLDESIDWELLARKVRLTGGSIRNVLLNAAFYAAQDEKAIGMEHILRAVRGEYEKTGQPFIPHEFGEYAPALVED